MTYKEDGINSEARNVGRFFLAMIPWALGIGLFAWIGVYAALHEIAKEKAQENRAAVYTGAVTRPKEKIAIEILPHDCSHITTADLDGDDLMLYATNTCHEKIDVNYFEWHWQTVSPNGTLLRSGYTNSAFDCPMPLRPGDKAECKFTIDDDDRTAKIQVWTQFNP